MKKFFTPIGRFLKNNYWLQPLILVAIVFILVFSIQGFQGAIDSIKGWFSPNSTCKECERVDYNKVETQLTNISSDGAVYVLYYEKNCDGCKEVYPAVNNFIKYYKDAAGNEVTFYAVNYGVKEWYTVSSDEPKTFYDKSLDVDSWKDIEQDVEDYMIEAGKLNSGAVYKLVMPTLVRYTKTTEGYEVNNIMVYSETLNPFTFDNLKLFVQGDYNA